MSNNKDFKVKNGIKPTSYQESLGSITSGSVTSGYDLSVAAYASKSLTVSGQDTTAQGFTLSSDGSKLYFVGSSGDAVYQYSLSTAWDLSTASYDSVSLSVTSQDSTPNDVRFKTDGTKMYVIGSGSDAVYQYSLSTAWDLSTASYDSVSFSVASQDVAPYSFVFKPDGTKMFFFGGATQDIFQYSLSTAWDISTASYDGVSYDLTSGYPAATAIEIKPDGTKLYLTDTTFDGVYQFSLLTAWDISTASYDSVSFSASSQDTQVREVRFSSDGTSMYILGATTGRIYQYSTGTTLTTNSLDLSTGNAFQITPTSDIQVGLSNPAASGTVTQGTLLLDGSESTGVSSKFSTTLYTGNATERDIVTGINLADDGGLLWVKNRSSSSDHSLWDTDGGARKSLNSNSTQSAYYSTSPSPADKDLKSINDNGFSIFSAGYNANLNTNSAEYVAWSFKKQTSFFDVVSWTGTGVARTIPHALSDEVGMILVKRTSSSGTNWQVFHRALGSTPQSTVIYLDVDATLSQNNSRFNNTLPTSSVFSLSSDSAVNGSGETYVAYVFAHDTSADSLIKCGSFTGNVTVDLGFQPQFLLVKRYDSSGDWAIVDSIRGMPALGAASELYPNNNGPEGVGGAIGGASPSSTGFTISGIGDTWDYIYMAIRAESVPTVTYDSTIQFAGGTAPDSPAIGETDVLTFSTRDGGTTYQAAQAIDGAK